VVTIENPIEFLHRDLSCSITQREVGVDTESIVIGLRAALRQDPDVVVIGEMADAETIDTAIKAAETGHLVFATMPTADVVATIERVIAALPAHEREVGRMRFAEALRAIVSQQLLPEKEEKARVPAVEVMVMTPAIRDIIRDAGRTADILRHMTDDRKKTGSQTYRQHLEELVQGGLISSDTAKAAHAVAKPSPGSKRGTKQAAAG
jgi:twitching motility protein PilT